MFAASSTYNTWHLYWYSASIAFFIWTNNWTNVLHVLKWISLSWCRLTGCTGHQTARVSRLAKSIDRPPILADGRSQASWDWKRLVTVTRGSSGGLCGLVSLDQPKRQEMPQELKWVWLFWKDNEWLHDDGLWKSLSFLLKHKWNACAVALGSCIVHCHMEIEEFFKYA